MSHKEPAPGYIVTDFTGIHPEVVAIIADLHPDDVTVDDLAAELSRRFKAAKIEPPFTPAQARCAAMELQLRARAHRDKTQ